MKSALVRRFTFQVGEVLMTFFPPVSEPLHQVVRSRFTQRLVELHEACQRSQFFWVRKLIDLICIWFFLIFFNCLPYA